MNRTDLFTRTAIEVINPLTLTEFVSKVIASGPIAAGTGDHRGVLRPRRHTPLRTAPDHVEV